MHDSLSSRLICFLFAFTTVFVLVGFSQSQNDDFSTSFVAGREYYILRSGNAKLILQSDKAGLQPAFTYMLFDAGKPCQTLRKERAFNYSSQEACSSSALEVVLGGVAFTALGHNTEVHWNVRDGIPCVEATWWAGGIRVQESFSALEGANGFLRRIVLSGMDIAGTDFVRLRLSLPPGTYFKEQSILQGIIGNISMGIAVLGGIASDIDGQHGRMETAPIRVVPGGVDTIETLLITRIPAKGYWYQTDCDYDSPIGSRFLLAGAKDESPHGLKAECFNNPDLLGAPVLVRIDTMISPSLVVDSSTGKVKPDSFSVRWTGRLRSSASGVHNISLSAHGKARLSIDGKLVIDLWQGGSPYRKTAEVPFESGNSYDIRIEYADRIGYGNLRLRWTMPARIAEENEVEMGVKEFFVTARQMIQTRAFDEMNRTRSQWGKSNSIKTSDSMMQSLFTHTSFALPGMVSADGRMDAGVFEYGNQWVRDGSNVALGLIHAGHFESARSILNYILGDLVSAEGATAVYGGFDKPDYEEFDQMGELVHVLKAYRDWTGDSTLIINYRTKIIAMIERPLNAAFRDSTGMVHNHREYWERSFDDAYELAYQTFMVQGLRDAADLSPLLAVPQQAPYWRAQAEVFLNAMLHHPTRSLVEKGSLTKRRNVDGTVADSIPSERPDPRRDDPRSTEAYHKLNPDVSYALPILLHLIDPKSDLSIRTLDNLEPLWNARWSIGGYERYHSSSQQDQPGPWCFGTAFVARAQQDAGLYARSRRSLQWLSNVQGGSAGAWFEEIPLNRSQVPEAGIVPWASAEIATFTVRHWLGVRFEGNNLIIRPNLFPEDKNCNADLRFRSSRIKLKIERAGTVSFALVNGRKVLPRPDGAIVVPERSMSGDLEIYVLTK